MTLTDITAQRSAVMCCGKLCCAIRCSVVLLCAVLCAMLCYAMLYSAAVRCILLCRAELHHHIRSRCVAVRMGGTLNCVHELDWH
eukprot:gene10842-biopygen2936